MPNNKGHFTLVSDSSGVACGEALYQEQKRWIEIGWIEFKEVFSSSN